MKQWLNAIAALVGALILGGTVLIGLQNPPPTEVRRPEPSPTTTIVPDTTPIVFATPTPSGRLDVPDDRRGMILAIQRNGTLRLIAPDGVQTWTLDLKQPITNAAWAPDGRHIVGATGDGSVVMTHPERQDAFALLPEQRRLASNTLSWKDRTTVALAFEGIAGTATVALWSYRNREMELLGTGRAPAVAGNGSVAWVTLDSRSIMRKRDAAAPDVLITPEQLDTIFAASRADARSEIAQSHASALAWSPDGTDLAFTAITHREGITFDWAIAVVTADGTLQHWMLRPDTAVYQLGWLPGSQMLVFSDDHGLGLIDLTTGLLQRLLPQHPDARYFASDSTGAYLIVSTRSGLYRVPTSAITWPQVEVQPFGPPTSSYHRLDVCCSDTPGSVAEP
jgi:dipeptidyl aminopeptidase/acylaminoacyl peptidase